MFDMKRVTRQEDRGEWTSLPDITMGSCHTNICLFNGLLYFCGCSSTSFEMYDPETNKVTTSVALPEKNRNVVFEDGGLLVVISNGYISRYNAQLQQVFKQARSGNDLDCSSYRVVYDGKVYIVQSGKCIWMNKDNGQTIAEIS